MTGPQGIRRKAHFLGTKIKSLRKRDNLTLEDLSVRCIQVDRQDGMYLVGRSMIPTHNSFMAAAVGMYMWGCRACVEAMRSESSGRVRKHHLSVVVCGACTRRRKHNKSIGAGWTCNTLPSCMSIQVTEE